MLGEIGYVVACARSVYTALITTAKELRSQAHESNRPRASSIGSSQARPPAAAAAATGSNSMRESRARAGTYATTPSQQPRNTAPSHQSRKPGGGSDADRLMWAMRRSGFM